LQGGSPRESLILRAQGSVQSSSGPPFLRPDLRPRYSPCLLSLLLALRVGVQREKVNYVFYAPGGSSATTGALQPRRADYLGASRTTQFIRFYLSLAGKIAIFLSLSLSPSPRAATIHKRQRQLAKFYGRRSVSFLSLFRP
jgi:hypothetical protein